MACSISVFWRLLFSVSRWRYNFRDSIGGRVSLHVVSLDAAPRSNLFKLTLLADLGKSLQNAPVVFDLLRHIVPPANDLFVRFFVNVEAPHVLLEVLSCERAGQRLSHAQGVHICEAFQSSVDGTGRSILLPGTPSI